MIDTKDNLVIYKTIYSAYDGIKDTITSDDVIYLCGIDSECCVFKTAFDLFENGYDVKVLKDYSACTHGEESNKYILNVIVRNIGKSNVI